jgi:hypothetical protein
MWDLHRIGKEKRKPVSKPVAEEVKSQRPLAEASGLLDP